MSTRRRIAVASAAAAVAAGVVGGLAGTATATPTGTGYIKQQYVTSYSSPASYTSAVHTGLTAGTAVDVKCFRQGEPLNGNPYWFMINKDGKLGYVHRDNIWAPLDTPGCGG